MATVELRGLDDFIAGLRAQQNENMPFALAKSLTDIAGIAKTNTITEMQNVLDRPTPFTLNSLRIDMATKTNLKSRVWFKSPSVLRPDHYLLPQVEGGARTFKPFEARLWRRGVLPDGYFTTPGSGATLDAFGNIASSQIVQILSFFDSFTEAGYGGNMGTAGRERLARATRSRYGTEYFAIQPNSGGGLKPGIYQRIFSNFGTAIKPIMRFVRSTSYRTRLDIQKIGDKTYDENFPDVFRRNFLAAIQTSWPPR